MTTFLKNGRLDRRRPNLHPLSSKKGLESLCMWTPPPRSPREVPAMVEGSYRRCEVCGEPQPTLRTQLVLNILWNNGPDYGTCSRIMITARLMAVIARYPRLRAVSAHSRVASPRCVLARHRLVYPRCGEVSWCHSTLIISLDVPTLLSKCKFERHAQAAQPSQTLVAAFTRLAELTGVSSK